MPLLDDSLFPIKMKELASHPNPERVFQMHKDNQLKES